jgi:hypothetical protein
MIMIIIIFIIIIIVILVHIYLSIYLSISIYIYFYIYTYIYISLYIYIYLYIYYNIPVYPAIPPAGPLAESTDASQYLDALLEVRVGWIQRMLGPGKSKRKRWVWMCDKVRGNSDAQNYSADEALWTHSSTMLFPKADESH